MTPDLTGGLLAELAAADEPGLAVGVYAGGELVSSAAAGCAVVEHGVRVTEHTVFDIASVSKHVTSACLLLLAADGLVELDADIRALLPELALAEPVTLRQCLTHTAGLRDYGALGDLAGIPISGITEDRFLDLVAGQRDLDFAPGSEFSYSNTGYALASVIVRRAAGTGLGAFAAERVFGPLGMRRTHFRDDVSLLVPNLAAGYLVRPGGGFRRCDVTEELTGDGAIVTTIDDLAGWHAFMATGAGLGTGIRDALLTRGTLTAGAGPGTPIGYALGLESIELAGHRAWWHSGSWAGYRAAVVYLPGSAAGVSVLANRDDVYPTHVALAVAAAMLTGRDARDAYRELRGIPAAADLARRATAAVTGLWHDPDADVFAEIATHGDQVALLEGGERHVLTLGTDGRWHGTGAASSACYAVRDGGLVAFWGPSERPAGTYRRVLPEPEAAAEPLAAGLFRNDELRADAELRPAGDGGFEIVIGLAGPRPLVPAGAGRWRSRPVAGQPGPVTVQVAGDGTALLVSVPRARRVRFDRIGRGPAGGALPRGLSGLR